MKLMRVLALGGAVLDWFTDAAADGKITPAELATGVARLVEIAGFADRVTIEAPPLEPLDSGQ